MPFDILVDIFGELAGELAGELGDSFIDVFTDIGFESIDLKNLDLLSDGDLSSVFGEFSDLPDMDMDYFNQELSSDFSSIGEISPDIDTEFSPLEDALKDTNDFSGEFFHSDQVMDADIAGFEYSDFGNNEIATTILSGSVPAEHLTELDSVNYYSEMPEPGVVGGYLPHTDQIELYNSTFEENIETFRHEVGHRVFYSSSELQHQYFNVLTETGDGLHVDPDLYDKSVFLHESFANDYADYLKDPTRFTELYPDIAEIIKSTMTKTVAI